MGVQVADLILAGNVGSFTVGRRTEVRAAAAALSLKQALRGRPPRRPATFGTRVLGRSRQVAAHPYPSF